MSNPIWLSEAQMRRIKPRFPLSHGGPRVFDRIFAALAAKGAQMSHYKGAALMIDALPGARTLLGDKGY